MTLSAYGGSLSPRSLNKEAILEGKIIFSPQIPLLFKSLCVIYGLFYNVLTFYEVPADNKLPRENI